MKYETSNSQKSYTGIIWGVSIVAVLIILVINYIPLQTRDDIFGIDIHTLPLFNAIFNGTSLLLLLCAFVMIKKWNINAYRNFIFAAFTVTFFFLITYLTYHTLAPSTSLDRKSVL